MLLRATRLCRMSPQMATLSPSIRPNWSRRVSMSSSPWVGCSCLPSPALMTLERIRSPRNCAAPEARWRITTMSIRIASRLRAVSTRVSPLLTERARRWPRSPCRRESRFSANSKEMRVRVEASKKRLTMVLPRSAGTFLIGRSLTSLNGSAVSRMRRICSAREVLEADQVLAERAPSRQPPRTSSTASPPSSSRDQHVDPVARAGAHRDARRCRPGSAARARRGRPARRAGSGAGGRSRRTRRAPRAPCGRCRAHRPR